MSAARDPDALSVCVLQDAQRRDRSSSCAVALDSRPFGTRSAAYSGSCDHRYDVFNAADDAAGCHGSGAAEDDEHHDAGHAWHHELELAGRLGLVLVGGPVDRDRAAGGDESHIARPRDARDDGEAGEKKREIAVSHQPSVQSCLAKLKTES